MGYVLSALMTRKTDYGGQCSAFGKAQKGDSSGWNYDLWRLAESVSLA
jgi:hypothetical protein